MHSVLLADISNASILVVTSVVLPFVTALMTWFLTKRKYDAEAETSSSAVWKSLLDEHKAEIERLKGDVTKLRQDIQDITKREMSSMGMQIELLKENKDLHNRNVELEDELRSLKNK